MLINIINIICLSNLALLIVLLWCRKNNSKANLFLGGLVFLTFSALVGNFLMYRLYPPYAFFKKQEMVITFLFGFFIWSYINQLLGVKTKIDKTYLIHFIPGFIMELIFLRDCFMDAEGKQLIIREIRSGIHTEYNIANLVFVLHTFGYITYCYFYIRKFEFNSSHYYSNADFIKLTWAKKLIVILLLLNIAAIIAYSISLVIPGITAMIIELIYIPILASGMQLFIVYRAFNNSTIITQKEFENYSSQLKDFHEFRNKKIKVSSASNDSEETFQKIIHLLESEKIYLNEELNLKTLAEKTSIPIHQLSQVINFRFHKNFSEVINSYRTEEAKRLLSQQSNYSIEGIAFEAGFGSKATFNRVFKKQTGLTPSEYINQTYQKEKT